ncbi:MAG: DNA polymerase/3'-5' exonuclease PolX [Spirochaetes bacterium]|nr:MAG: DNA polymerase/3'-5' exonuclease PolX [Spirochaetota bacterium]
MKNKEIADLLRLIGIYKELSGEDVFRVRAYQQAAKNIEMMDRDIEELYKKGELRSIKGVGKSVEEIINEYLGTGKSSILEEFRKKYPDSLLELLSIPGMGPRKVKVLWEKLGISNLGELEYACRENRLISLEGFGLKTQEKILRGIELRKRYREQHLYPEAEAIAKELLEEIKSGNMVDTISIAGSLRRGKTILKDIDMIVVPKDSTGIDRLVEYLTTLTDSDNKNEGIIAAGETKVSIRKGGIQVDFRIISRESYPTALQHFTGSKEHNTILRSRAKEMGLKMNEYGIYRDSEKIPVSTEEEVYGALNLKYIPPEIREGGDEIRAAETDNLPELVTEKDIKGIIHVHSNYSDGINSVKELAEYCIKKGYRFICISDHSKSAYYANGLSVERILEQIDEIKKLNSELKPFRIFCGIESDILSDGSLDYPDDILEKLDFVIASIHSRLSMSEEEATERLLKAIENPYTTILGHISGRLLLSREGYRYNETLIMEAMKKYNVALEHNCNPHRLDPDWPMMKRAAEMGIPVSLGPDAHSIEGLEDMRYGIMMARKGWLEKKNLLNCMEPEELDEYFRRKKKQS